MADVLDVAAYILKKCGTMTAMKLQKLVYYSQAWSLVWDEEPLFDQRIEAWANGPVAPKLYNQHRGKFKISSDDVSGNPKALDKNQRETVDEVVRFYGKKTAQWLSDLTHMEAPWEKARKRAKVDDGEACDEAITFADMAEYYGSLKRA